MPIYSPTGFLDITNATLRTSNTECQNLKIGTGNLYVTSEISPDYELNLSNVTNLGATSPHTLTLSNVTTAIDATSNIITSGNLKIGGLIYTKDWGIRSASGSNDLYVGRFTVHGITEVLITDQGASLGSASKYTITRNVNSTPLVNGIDSSSTIDYQWYFTSHDSTTYDLWVRPSATVQTNIKVTSSTYIPVDEPTGVTLIPCVNGLINMSGNVVANQNLTVSGNTFYTSPVSINVDSNVVTEYTGPHDRPLREYPEIAMTTASETSSGYKGYKVSTSSQLSGYEGYKAFDKTGWETPAVENNNAWVSGGSKYVAGTGLPDTGAFTTSYVGGTATGEYIQLQLPRKIKISKYDYTPRTHTGNDEGKGAPKTVKLLGSNDDGSTWTLIKDITHMGTRPDEGEFYTARVDATEYYDYIRFVATSTYSDGNSAVFTDVRLSQIRFYGYEEGSGSIDTTFKSVYNVPATTGTQLDVYYDGQDYGPSVPTSITDKTGNGNNTTTVGSGIGFDSTYKAFTFDGTSNGKIVGTHDFSGDASPVLTMSFWMKRTAVMGSYDYIATIGTAATGQMIGLTTNPSNQFNFGNQGDGVITDEPILLNQWYHVTLVANGEAAFNSTNFKPYINGKEPKLSSYGAGSTTNLTGSQVTFGTNSNGGQPFKGSIANFRLYSKALNAGQIQELYDYQKDYFLGSKSQVTLYKGHLGVGVTEPSGQLELAGDERIQEYPPRDLYQYDTNIEGHGVFCVTASNEYLDGNHPAWEAFSDSSYTTQYPESVWTTDDLYDASTGLHDGSATTAGIKGEWIQLKTPYTIKISSFNLNSYAISVNSNRQPRDFILLGSNDGNVWEQMKSVADQTKSEYTGVAPVYSGPLGGPHHTVNSTKYYSYFRIVVTANYGENLVGISRIRFYGTPGPTTLDKGSLSLTRSLDVPRISRYDVDTETPRPEKLLVDFDTTVNSSPTDISGKGNHGTLRNNATYSPEDKAFKFSAAGHYIHAELNNSETGNQYHSVSLWFNITSGQTSNWRCIFECGENPRSGTSDISLYIPGNTNTISYSNGGGHMYSDTLTNLYFQWHHVVLTYDGANRKMYLDGELHKTQATTSWAGVANMTLRIGRTNASASGGEGIVNGLISNFKLYWQTALEPSEIKKLYRLGRTGRSMVISDTAVGIGRAPEAQLDVRGTLRYDKKIPLPGEIIEEINTVCNGRPVTVQSGTYTPTNVTARQDSSQTHTEINGSNITYNKPPDAKRIYYKFVCQWNDASKGAITSFKIQIYHNGSWRDINPSKHAHAAQYLNDGNNHGAARVINEYVFECDADTESENDGYFLSSKTSYQFRVTWRHHGTNDYNSTLHRLDFFDGSVHTNPIHKPQLTIRAIA